MIKEEESNLRNTFSALSQEPAGIWVKDYGTVGKDPYRTVEKDPTGRGAKDAGSKLDFGKPDCSLLGYFGNALLAVAEVGTYGAAKYTRGGWQHVPDGINRYTAAMLRHYLKENESELDDDLPVLHAAQVAWNALARLELMLREKK